MVGASDAMYDLHANESDSPTEALQNQMRGKWTVGALLRVERSSKERKC